MNIIDQFLQELFWGKKKPQQQQQRRDDFKQSRVNILGKNVDVFWDNEEEVNKVVDKNFILNNVVTPLTRNWKGVLKTVSSIYDEVGGEKAFGVDKRTFLRETVPTFISIDFSPSYKYLGFSVRVTSGRLQRKIGGHSVRIGFDNRGRINPKDSGVEG